jgi:hypothetical protein
MLLMGFDVIHQMLEFMFSASMADEMIALAFSFRDSMNFINAVLGFHHKKRDSVQFPISSISLPLIRKVL